MSRKGREKRPSEAGGGHRKDTSRSQGRLGAVGDARAVGS